MVGMVHEPVGPAVRRGPGDRPLRRLQRRLLGTHAGGARPADDAAGERVSDERRVVEASVRRAHVGDVGDMQPVRRRRLELPFHQIRSSARALRRFRRHRRPAAPDALNAELAHDVHHPVASDSGRIPAPGDQPGMHLPVSVHGREEIRVDLEDIARQRLVTRPHAADGTRSEHAVAARRNEPAVQRPGRRPADRPDPETALEFVDVRDHQRRVGSSPAAKKADAVVKISFARRDSAFSRRSRLSSSIASSADCLVSAATVASALSRHRPGDSGAIPGSFATAAIAFVSDEYEERDSVGSRTAFALNSGVHLVPFAMVPSSPIELGEMRNKNQVRSVR